MFRMTRETFEEVLDLIRRSWKTKKRLLCETLLETKEVSLRHELFYSTIRFLAGGTYLDICFSFCIAFGSFFGRKQGVLWKTSLGALD